MAEPHRRFLTVRVDRRLYALPSEDIVEVIRVPAVARVPQGPRALMGVANLRGSVLPVASLSALLGQGDRAISSTSRAIVLQGAAPVALAVDGVEALVTVAADRVETRQAQLSTETGEQITGAIQSGADQDVVKVLDIQALLSVAFVQKAQPARVPRSIDALARAADDQVDDHDQLVTFEVAGQEFALSLDAVREITPAPIDLAVVPKSEALVLGIAAYRDSLLPLLSLRGLLGFPPVAAADDRQKVVVTRVGGVLVGLVVDRMRAILPADPLLIEAVPSVLAARTGGEARIKAIYRGEEGRRLVSILAPDQLFREDVMQRLSRPGDTAHIGAVKSADATRDERRFLVFRLGQEEFALPIEAIDEVAPVPGQITRVPKTPAFLEGVINLRGEVLPVVDQRKRFDMPASEDAARRRLIVVRTDRHRAGLIVDTVSEVLACDDSAIDAAPDLTGEATRLVDGVINLQAAGRIVLILDPAELLSRAERGLLDAFQATAAAK